MKTVLACPPHFLRNCPAAVQRLEQNGIAVRANPHDRPFSRDELLAAADGTEAVIAAFEAWDEAAFAAVPSLKLVVRFGTGVDTVDLDAARRHGVIVCNCPGANAASVAEHTVALLLAMVRDIPRLDTDVHAGRWPRLVFSELGGRTFGIVGLGAIGQRVARLLSGFDMRLLACTRTPNPDLAASLGVQLCDLDELLRESDFISLHLPGSPGTAQLINAAAIARMKPGVRLINTARAALIDEPALASALQDGRVAGLACDVFSEEPVPASNLLLQCPHVIATPHLASASRESLERLGDMAAAAVIAVLSGREPPSRLA